MERGSREYQLAERIIHLEDALHIANENARKEGKLGVGAQTSGVSFHKAATFHARVRRILKNL
jgi:hypothetical protein